MAVLVGTAEVIDDSRVLQNIAGANGFYNSFHPVFGSIASTIDMNKPIMNCIMNGNLTFTESNKAAGKTAVLLLDTRTVPYTPTFSSNIKWAEDLEPTWSDYRFWNIALVCWDSNTIRAAAVGFNN